MHVQCYQLKWTALKKTFQWNKKNFTIFTLNDNWRIKQTYTNLEHTIRNSWIFLVLKCIFRNNLIIGFEATYNLTVIKFLLISLLTLVVRFTDGPGYNTTKFNNEELILNIKAFILVSTVIIMVLQSACVLTEFYSSNNYKTRLEKPQKVGKITSLTLGHL
jgi:hypothetical protein